MFKFIRKNPKIFTAVIVVIIEITPSLISNGNISRAEVGLGNSLNQNGGQTAGTIYNFNPTLTIPYESKQPLVPHPLDTTGITPQSKGGAYKYTIMSVIM